MPYRSSRRPQPGPRSAGARTGAGAVRGEEPAVAGWRRLSMLGRVVERRAELRGRMERVAAEAPGWAGAVLRLAWARARESKAEAAWDATAEALTVCRADGPAGMAAKLEAAVATILPWERTDLSWRLVLSTRADLERACAQPKVSSG